MANNSHLYNGVEFKDYNIHNYDIGFPFYNIDDWMDGNVDYDGMVYFNVSILYDILRDKVIIEHAYSHFKLELITEKVKSFTVTLPERGPEHKFVRLIADSVSKSIISTGFYDLLYDGTVKVYAKRKKIIQTTTDLKLEITEYRERTHLFIYKNGTYYPVKGKGSAFKVFAERKAKLRKYLSDNKIKFAKNREYAFIKSAKFYDESGK